MMPVLNGVGFLENYKNTINADTAIILLSNLSSGADLQKAAELGADKSFLKSDLSPKQLISMIRYELEAST